MCAPNGWENYDASPTLFFERIPILGRFYTKNARRFPRTVRFGDIVRGLPVPPETCEAVYCSHVLEHLTLEDFRTALKNTYSILRPGGTFRLVVPDLAHLAKSYCEDSSHDANYRFLLESDLGTIQRERGLKGWAVAVFGHSKHLWMWDFKGLHYELETAGFVCVRRAQFGDSENPAFSEVEDPSRWANALGVECKRPPPYARAGQEKRTSENTGHGAQ
jgi:SAM-dependent methyltransferase